MPVRSPLLLAVFACLAVAAPAAAAPPVTITPGVIDIEGRVSPPYGTAVYKFTDEYDAFGLRLSDGDVRTAVFDDDPTPAGVTYGWSGVTAAVSTTDGRAEMTLTTSMRLTPPAARPAHTNSAR